MPGWPWTRRPCALNTLHSERALGWKECKRGFTALAVDWRLPSTKGKSRLQRCCGRRGLKSRPRLCGRKMCELYGRTDMYSIFTSLCLHLSIYLERERERECALSKRAELRRAPLCNVTRSCSLSNQHHIRLFLEFCGWTHIRSVP